MTREQWDKLSPDTQFAFADILYASVQSYMHEVHESELTIEGSIGLELGELAVIKADPR